MLSFCFTRNFNADKKGGISQTKLAHKTHHRDFVHPDQQRPELRHYKTDKFKFVLSLVHLSPSLLINVSGIRIIITSV